MGLPFTIGNNHSSQDPDPAKVTVEMASRVRARVTIRVGVRGYGTHLKRPTADVPRDEGEGLVHRLDGSGVHNLLGALDLELPSQTR